MTKEELEMRKLVRESDVVDRTDGSELAKAFNYLWEKYIEQESCEDAISRDDAIRIAEQGQIQGFEWEIQKLVTLPPVTPQPKTGHWIPLFPPNDERDDQKCSVCGYISGGATRYCADCGTKMVEPQERSDKE